MKVLCISDEAEISKRINVSLERLDFAVINYRWFLKALDNIEEIKPDVICINVSEYPRHWKTLSQFVKLASWKVQVVLILREKLSENEMEKASQLQVETVLYDLNFEESLKTVFNKITNYEKQETFNIPQNTVKEVKFTSDETIEEDDSDEIPSVSAIVNEKLKSEEMSVKENKKAASKKKFGSLLKRISNEYEK